MCLKTLEHTQAPSALLKQKPIGQLFRRTGTSNTLLCSATVNSNLDILPNDDVSVVCIVRLIVVQSCFVSITVDP